MIATLDYNKFMPADTRSYSELVDRTRWYVYLRWVILLLVIIPSLIASYFDVGLGARFTRDMLFCIFALMSNGLFHLLTYTLKNTRVIKALAYILVLADTTLITFFLHSKGGIESRSIILYILPMIASAAILGRKGTYLTTALSIIGFTFIILGAYFGILGQPLSMYTPELDRDPGYVANTVVFFDFVLLVGAIAIDYMTRLLINGEAQAQEALTRMRQAQLVAKTGSWEYDVLTREVHYSPELYAVLGNIIGSQTMNSTDLIGLVHPDDRSLIKRKFAASVKRAVTLSFDCRMLSGDGTIHYLHVDGRSFGDGGKSSTITRIIGSARDITDEKALQKARNDFVALASHQLRTPATIVKQYVGMLKDEFVGSVTEQQKQMLQIAYDTNERQIKIVNDLLNVARIDSNSYKIDRKRVNLNELLERIVRDQATKFNEKQQSIKLKPTASAIYAKVDADSLRMAIDNLLDNAHKYTPPGKVVRIALQKSARSAIISINDQGIGIAKSDLPKMFKIFSRVENPLILQQEGTGLGLYWADRIVRLHKGKITVNSELGKGTTFTITVPM